MVKRFYEYVDMIIYINLDKRVDRDNEIKVEFNRLEIPADKITRLTAIENKVGAIGCTMSHIRALQMIQNNTWERVLILEDDFMFLVDKETLETQCKLFFEYVKEYDICLYEYPDKTNQNTQYLENWFLMAPKESVFINDLYFEFDKYLLISSFINIKF
jgi:GR25 family glycosyltransferase involved in LPS biosynthesis